MTREERVGAPPPPPKQGARPQALKKEPPLLERDAEGATRFDEAAEAAIVAKLQDVLEQLEGLAEDGD